MDMDWEIVRNGEDTDGEVLEANGWFGPRQPSPPVHVHDNAEDSFEIVEGRLDVKLRHLAYLWSRRARRSGSRSPAHPAKHSR